MVDISDHGGLLVTLRGSLLVHWSAPMASEGGARPPLRAHPNAGFLLDARHGTPLLLLEQVRGHRETSPGAVKHAQQHETQNPNPPQAVLLLALRIPQNLYPNHTTLLLDAHNWNLITQIGPAPLLFLQTALNPKPQTPNHKPLTQNPLQVGKRGRRGAARCDSLHTLQRLGKRTQLPPQVMPQSQK